MITVVDKFLRRVLFDIRMGSSNMTKSRQYKMYPSLQQNENSQTTCHIGEVQKIKLSPLSQRPLVTKYEDVSMFKLILP